MIRLVKLQILGPLAAVLILGAAEAAAFALARFPTSGFLWYVNLKVFHVFQETAFILRPPLDLPYAQFFIIALPLFAVALYGLFTERLFPLALASHLSFIYAGFVFYCLISIQMHPSVASLANIAFSNRPDIYLPLSLGGASLFSFLVSHYQYVLGILNKRSSEPRA